MSHYQNNKNNKSNIPYYALCFLVFCVSAPIGIMLFLFRFIPWAKQHRNQQNQSGWEHVNQRQWQQSYASQYNHGQQPSGRLNQQLFRRLSNPLRGQVAQIAGFAIAALFALTTLSMLVDDLWLITYGRFGQLIGELLIPIVLTGGSLYLALWGRKLSEMARRTREYVTIIGQSNQISLQELSRITNLPYHKVADDINRLVSRGLFGDGAYVDQSSQYLILNSLGREAVDQQAKEAAARQEAKASEEFKEDDILIQIRRVNDEINDRQLSNQIDRIEEITRLILRYQKDHPDQSAQLHSFLSYYLPTTLKILNAYAELERQSIQGKNITETRQQIEGIMEKVVTGFENQLDQLFANSRMDISSEIHVLENMLQQDGLTGSEQDPFGQVLGQQ